MWMNLVVRHLERHFSNVRHLSTEELNAMVDGDEEGLVVVDARRQDEYDVSHLPRALRLHFASDPTQIQEFLASLPSNSVVVCYCSLGYRSALLASKMAAAASDQHRVFNLSGSIFKWANEDRPMVDKEGHKTKHAHPFSYAFGLMLDRDKRKWE